MWIRELITSNRLGSIILCLNLLGCAGGPNLSLVANGDDSFTQSSTETIIPYATPDMLALYESDLKRFYEMGPGDILKIQIWKRPELSGEHIIGPFGAITLNMLGDYTIGGQTRTDAVRQITQLYETYYEDPRVTVKILKYMNNKVFILGRVTNPGIIHFDGNGTLLEALALAGGLPTRDKTIFLSKCSIIRGNNQIIWVDLVQLLQKGNLKLNVKLKNNDIIHIPESTDAAVFVMGEVKNPGSYEIQTPGLTLLDVINLAGGPSEDSNVEEIRIIRNMKESNVRVINLNKIIEQGDFTENYVLKDDDIIFIPRKGIAEFNYYLRQIDPLIRTFVGGALLGAAL